MEGRSRPHWTASVHGFGEHAMPAPRLLPPSRSHCLGFTVAHIRSVTMFCAGVKGRQQPTSFLGALDFPQADLAMRRRSVFTDSSPRSEGSISLIARRTHCLNAAGAVAVSHEHTPGLRWICPRISPPVFAAV